MSRSRSKGADTQETAQRRAVESWDDWFRACGEVATAARTYEDLVGRWEERRAADMNEARAAFAQRHDRSFWKKRPVLSPRQVKRLVVCAVVGIVGGFVLSVVLGIATGAGISIVAGMPVALAGLLIAVIAGFVPGFVGTKMLERKMAKLEPGLADVLRYVPPKYRNGFCLDAIGDMWSAYGIGSFDQAVKVLDEHISNNRGSYVPIQILFDVPVSKAAPDGTFHDESEELADTDAPDLSAPGLPADIESRFKEGVDDPEARLAELIGMEGVKRQVRQMKSRVEFFGDAKAAGNGGNHMIFVGPAGVGKTETARIITRILYDFGYIRANRLLEVDGEYLKSAYIGQTGERTGAIVQAAKGGVLFVDEAYLLFDEKANNSVGKEATGVLLKAMEDDREDLVVILAGYEDGINRLIASNEGFASRIKHKIYFEDYSAEELGEIFRLFLEKGNQSVHEIEQAGYDMLVSHFDAERKMPGFGNAREARNALDKLLDVHADRYMDGEVVESDKMRITEADVAAFIVSERERLAADGRNFAATSHLDESIISLAELKTRTMDGAADPDAALDFLVGMERAKDEVRGFLRRAQFFESQGMEDASNNLNVVLVGEPGTGKSTLAGIITGYLYKAGYVRENRYVDVTGDFLKASYVGQTGKRTEAVIEYSKGQVLFLDEAYLLDTAGDGGHDFGAEALGVLVNAMEKSQGELVVILAGYDAEMDAMLERNPGMKSRIGTTIHLEDYTAKELCQIYRRIAKRKGFDSDKSLWQPMADYMRPLMGTRSFGNARFMRQLVDDCISAHADRYAAGQLAEGAERLLDAGDLELAVSKRV